jgi:hypothetical protein
LVKMTTNVVGVIFISFYITSNYIYSKYANICS